MKAVGSPDSNWHCRVVRFSHMISPILVGSLPRRLDFASGPARLWNVVPVSPWMRRHQGDEPATPDLLRASREGLLGWWEAPDRENPTGG